MTGPRTALADKGTGALTTEVADDLKKKAETKALFGMPRISKATQV